MKASLKIVYIYDALCGWCYGFSKEILKLEAIFKGKIVFEVLSGGMITGERVMPISAMSAYIEAAYPTVELKTGVKFGDSYLNDILRKGSYVSNSLPPAIALKVLKRQKLLSHILLASAIQNLHYKDGKDLNDAKTYKALSEKSGISFEQFLIEFESEETRKETVLEFETVKSLGVRGFPTVLLFKENQSKGNHWDVVSTGYTSVEILSKKIHQMVEN